jgi:hypothetical protein
MSAKFLDYLRRHHVALLALFVALGGTSYAAATGSIDSRELKNNAVRSSDLRNNDVRGRDIRNGTIGTADVGNGSLLAEDFLPGQLPAGPQGRPGPQGVPGPQGLRGLKGDQGLLGPTFGRSGQGQCDPASTTFETCASTGPIDLPTSGRVLLIGASSWDNDLTTDPPNSGSCHLEADGNPVGPAGSPFEVDAGEATTTHNPGQGGSIAVTAVSGVLPAGPHTFALVCNQTDGSMFFTDSTVSAVLLGGS